MNLAQLSPAGWCVLGLAAFFIVSLNVWLVGLLRHRKLQDPARRPADSLVKDTLNTMRSPFAAEKDQLKELAQKVEPFKKSGQNQA